MNREKESNFVSAVVYLHDNAGQISPFLERFTMSWSNISSSLKSSW